MNITLVAEGVKHCLYSCQADIISEKQYFWCKNNNKKAELEKSGQFCEIE